MITVAYKNIGRNKVCDIININVSKKEDRNIIAEKIANGAREFLISNNIEATEFKKNKFKIYAGFQIVGKAEII